MKQGLRFFTSPGVFVNQLQWSRSHWFLLLSFIGIALVENHVGSQQSVFLGLTRELARGLDLSWDAAYWFLSAIRLAVLLTGSYLVANAIWFLGEFFGRSSSKRVLYRRLSIVFTVLLAAYTISHLESSFALAGLISWVVGIWGVILGFFALREQFALSPVEAGVVWILALFLLSSGWHFSYNVVEYAAQQSIAQKKTTTINYR